MSEAKGDDGLGGRLIAGAIIVALAASSIGLFYQAGYEKDAANSTREYTRYAEQKVAQSCRGVPAIQMVSCFANARIEGELQKRDQQRDQADLIAQRKSALWTAIMGVAALIGMALSAAGVFLVWRTFSAARESNAISREAMMAENRAWIEIVPTFQCGDFRYLEEQREFRMKAVFTVKNIGETVALNVSFEIELIPDPSWFHETNAVDDFNEKLLRPTTVSAFPLFPEREAINDWDIGIAADKIRLPQDGGSEVREAFFPAFCVGVRYNTIFDREGDPPHITTEVGSVRRLHDGRPSLVILGRQTVPSAEIGVLRVFRNLTKVT